MILERLLPHRNYRVINLARHGQSWEYLQRKLSRGWGNPSYHVHIIDYSLHNHRMWAEEQKRPKKSRVDIDVKLGKLHQPVPKLPDIEFYSHEFIFHEELSISMRT